MYSKRVWLNKDNSPSTGSVVAYQGPIAYGHDEKEEAIFLEIASCHDKIRLHHTTIDTMQDFIEKMELLRNTIDNFITHLKTISHLEKGNET